MITFVAYRDSYILHEKLDIKMEMEYAFRRPFSSFVGVIVYGTGQ